MKKLIDLKKWLTVPETARHLATVFGEEVSEADVLRLALDGHLKLSANFVNRTKALKGKVIPIEDAEYCSYPPEYFPQLFIPEEHKGKPIQVMKGLNLDDKRLLYLEVDEVVTLDGVYDLLMLGNESSDVEHKYQILTGGPSVTLQCLDGAFVTLEDDTIYQLLESFDENEYQRGSAGHLRELKAQIAILKLEPPRVQEVLSQHKDERMLFLAKAKERRNSGRDSDNYYPAGGLPDDSVLVVRTDALRDFVLSQGQQHEAEDPVDTSLVEDPEVLIRTERNRSINDLPSVIGDEVRPYGRNVSTARREARKLNTQDMYKSWQKAYRLSFKKRPGESDVWHSIQISRQDLAKGRNAETIRKHMKS